MNTASGIFVREMKDKGLIKHIGFSFHDSADELDKILTAHPEMEFVQPADQLR